jgi:hypothetical protein
VWVVFGEQIGSGDVASRTAPGVDVVLLFDPVNDLWQHRRGFPAQRPPVAADLDRLRYLLLARPFRLSTTQRTLCIGNGIGFIHLDAPPR